MSDKNLSWDEAEDFIESQYDQTKTLSFEMGDKGEIEFTVRPLTRKEFKQLKSKMSKKFESQVTPQSTRDRHFNRQRQQDTDDEAITLEAQEFTLKKGIIDGPEGFDPQKDVDSLPPSISEKLYQEIDQMSDIDIRVKQNFR